MGELLKGTGQTVPCPTCARTFVLKPSSPPAPAAPTAQQTPRSVALEKSVETTAPPPAMAGDDAPVRTVPAAPALPPLVTTEKEKPAAQPKVAAHPLDQASLEFQSDPQFAGRAPTREQVARAWALVIFRRGTGAARPTHAELVVALGELFREFKPPSNRVRRSKPG